ncbi:V3/V1b-type arginine vasotocin receptor [Vibrio vulnificus]|uniref:V3/V1b-type arginine vasotocin receptor n=1 Tax=Vibrio vulnificus TaxID=672 RepID=UPI001A1DB72B|nr:V3/V1b-type arginine vasotocin receptor [Vibrio vulnificus]EGQ9635555.1 V3/V1b-type arginine vasotocin receptor [Vibrio cholerae]EGR0031583.1 V3/V1b-type arginine vasotocin receptor [Vibrio cholerae]ELH6329047.1 V3/V1b-type arginine vasotocin receptor [Vibrio cholerae]ELH9589674.1 V3/V1b-type arginine vasotocin receptor [Vibrio cholerae]ELI9684810.1 V3/V1b-type arginine vasotocin receptor [Vibrio vulnificus]
MDFVLNWIDQLSSFNQGLLGSAVFAISSWFVQKVFSKAKSSGSEFLDAYITLDVHKHVLHKHYVRSKNIQMASYGSSIALLLAARWVILAFMSLIFVFGVQSALDGKWLYVVGAWVSFNYMFEARNWVKDSGTDKSVAHIDQEKVQAVTEKLIPELVNNSESKHEIEQSKNG